MPSPFRRLAKWLYFVGFTHYCPMCKKTSRAFRPFGPSRRQNAKCPWCGSLERHRFLWLYLTKRPQLFPDHKWSLLHIAPEPSMVQKFSNLPNVDYLSGDIESPTAMVKMDITDIQYPDESFDAIVCSHVLEHVNEDRKAMSEFYRVLKSGGWAMLLVPITSDVTVEDPSVTDPAERLRLYGQEDHVRRYGPDYIDRLRDAGFTVEMQESTDIYSPEEIKKMGLPPEACHPIYFCTK